MLLAGDIGGTKTDLAIISPEAGPRKPLVEATFASERYSSLRDIVREFLAGVGFGITEAAFGVAGPVVGGRAEITNLPWIIEVESLQESLGLARVHLLNDLESIANAVPFLKPVDVHTLNEGKPAGGGAMAVIAPGTGLGEAYLTWDGHRYSAHPSEGGHADFGSRNALQSELLRYLLERHDHVSYERVCSGMGLPNPGFRRTTSKSNGKAKECGLSLVSCPSRARGSIP